MTLLEENGNAKKNIPERRFYMVYNLFNYNGNNAKIKKRGFRPFNYYPSQLIQPSSVALAAISPLRTDSVRI